LTVESAGGTVLSGLYKRRGAMATTLAFFNANNLFLRYKWARKYPGDISGKSYLADGRWGFVPIYGKGVFEPFKPEQTRLAAEALSWGGLPDILCVCEVENLLALRKFNDDFLGGYYDYSLLVDSRDFRQIDVGILSRKEIIRARSYVDDRNSKGEYIFSRDCLEVDVALTKSGSRQLTLFINHLKSKFVDTRGKSKAKIRADEKKANERRKKQAQHVRRIVRARFPGSSFNKKLFAVVGDFNDQPDSKWVRALTKYAGLYDPIGDLPEKERWTYWWKSKNRASQIDYILLSPKLAKEVKKRKLLPVIERGGIGTKGFLQDGSVKPGQTRIFRTDDDPKPLKTDFQFARFDPVLDDGLYASDHCPVFLEIPF
jgi:endonuclease/exonuclease/phosphatase family metal-dependent hydrolase